MRNHVNKLLKSMREYLKDAMRSGLSIYHAAAAAESMIIKRFGKERSLFFAEFAYRMWCAIRDKNQSKALKVLYGACKVLDNNAKHINNVLELFAASITHNKFVWYSKPQSSYVIKVVMGDRLFPDKGLREVSKGRFVKQYAFTNDEEWKGFSERKLVNYLMSIKRAVWAKKAGNYLMAKISLWIDKVIAAKHPQEIEACGRKKVSHMFGTIAYGDIWAVIGSISFYAALFERDVSEVHFDFVDVNGPDGKVHEVRPSIWSTKKLEAMRQRYTLMIDGIRREDVDNPEEELGDLERSQAAYGDHYAIQLLEQIKTVENQLDMWAVAHEMWLEIGILVGEYNETAPEAVKDMVDIGGAPVEAYLLPVGEIQPGHEWAEARILKHLDSTIESVEIKAYSAAIALSAEQARAEFARNFGS